MQKPTALITPEMPAPPANPCREGADALDELAGRYAAELFRLAYSMLGDADEADDAVQETLVAAGRALEDFQGRSSLRTWLFAIAINACRAQLRRRRARRALEQTLAAVQRLWNHAPVPEEQALASERSGELWAAVSRLDEKHRLVVTLRYVHDLPVGEIAAILAVNEGTVHSRLHYARKRLLEMLE
jgi:RNA polymerase sigma-70 factor (ECF subfamily)